MYVQQRTRRVLEAVDWSKEGEQGKTSSAWTRLLRSATNSAFQQRSLRQLQFARLALQDWTDRFWNVRLCPSQQLFA